MRRCAPSLLALHYDPVLPTAIRSGPKPVGGENRPCLPLIQGCVLAHALHKSNASGGAPQSKPNPPARSACFIKQKNGNGSARLQPKYSRQNLVVRKSLILDTSDNNAGDHT
jgi:hypothetical protein